MDFAGPVGLGDREESCGFSKMANKKKGKGFEAADDSKRLTAAEFQELGFFFKQLLENRYLAPWVIAAGVGAILEGLHIVWLAFRYLLGR